ncbi:MAG: hypothetical protein CL843_10940 [Crocinitomicaceae bacterium]|nr:hypothetical protein [Crocinitomicaceae bacterium]|tara:strand:- start:219 stop:1280 length:1062 start_codon:yes stop_codon:yes gene_type:complete
MLVQFYHPSALTKDQLDQFLANGWFRSSIMLHKSKVICLNETIFSIVNIRLPLGGYALKKRHRKLFRKVLNNFEVIIQPASITEEKNDLYNLHKKRFKGFVHNDLHQLMHAYFSDSVFETYEVAVYDQNKLIAFSFFDLGNTSMASILAVYDADYGRFSLGTFTMLAEIKFGQKMNLSYFYPGYVLDKPSEFDYKLTLGDMEYRNTEGDWLQREKVDFKDFPAFIINEKLEQILAALHLKGISAVLKYNPYYTVGYLDGFEDNASKSTGMIFIDFDKSKDQFIAFEYQQESDTFLLSQFERNYAMDHMFDMEITEELEDSEAYVHGLLSYITPPVKSQSVEALLKHYQRLISE